MATECGYGNGNCDYKLHDLERDLLKGNDIIKGFICDKLDRVVDKMDCKYEKLSDKIEFKYDQLNNKVADCCCKTQEAIAGLAGAMAASKTQDLRDRLIVLETKGEHGKN